MSNQSTLVGGWLGEQTAQALVRALTQLQASGTLLFEHELGSVVMLFIEGKPTVSHKLGSDLHLGLSGGRFCWYDHPPDPLPRLPGRFAGSQLAAFCAIPDVFATALQLSASYINFRALLHHLSATNFTGLVVQEIEAERGVLLFLAGRLASALFEAPGLARHDLDALRRMNRRSGSTATLALRPLPGRLTAALLGLARGSAQDTDLHTFSGIEANEAGYRYYQQGEPYLQIQAELVGSSGFYPSLAEPSHLTLPDEPPGWEQKRYQLTLRGRDVLNPMTDLAMGLGRHFDSRSRQLLRQLAQGTTMEEIAESSGTDLSSLRPRLERLLQEGLIREVEG
ncbi:MAG: hypothetical protein KGZ60_00375 [Truepera sp.]|nr:hypothetical protein [Truepera sp.]